MSIYVTLWKLQFPKDGDFFLWCGWIEVAAQGLPPHVGTPTSEEKNDLSCSVFALIFPNSL
jgi:hypothetical protein